MSDLLLDPRLHDLGDGFIVRRLLPNRLCRRVGPFVFFDHFGPVGLAPGRGMDVRPHPHIGLSTLTYLYEGAIRHRDSLGSDQVIRPGDVNWMTAGRGIVHSERTPEGERSDGHRLHGVQTWLALPLASEETEPSFQHHETAALPEADREGVRVRVIAGTAFGMRSPVRVYSPTLYVDVAFQAGARFVLDREHAERAVYPIEGEVTVAGEVLAAGFMRVIRADGDVEIRAANAARVLICGGAPLVGERIVWWNFVASSADRIERGKTDWREQRFGHVPGESEFIPLPDA